MASKYHRPISNLATRMENNLTIGVKDAKAAMASKTEKFDVDARTEDGKTALMYACGRNKCDLIKFLLEQGADPNAECDMGNTPLHHAVYDDFCYCVRDGICRYQYQDYEEGNIHYGTTVKRLEMLKLLISRGATMKCNSSGQSPVDLAALHTRSDIVGFFIGKSGRSRPLELSVLEQVRALQTLGVATALNNLQFDDERTAIESYAHFYKAQSLIESSGRGSPAVGKRKKSEIASAFSLFVDEEYSCKAWKGIRKNAWAIKTQAFVIAERVLPEDIKEVYLLPRLLLHARLAIFDFGKIETRLLQGIQICKDALKFEPRPDLDLSSVLRCILYGFHMESWQGPQLHDKVKSCFPLIDSCLEGLEGATGCQVQRIHRKVLYNLGSILLKLALSGCPNTPEIFESLLEYAVKIVRVIRRKCEGLKVTSITHFILHKGQAVNDCKKRSEKLNRVKRLISRLVQCEDPHHCTEAGNTMLHSLMQSCKFANQQFLKEVALILIRNGCDVQIINEYGYTVREMMMMGCKTGTSHPQALLDMVSPSKSVLSLEELAIRTVLRNRIPYEDKLPSHLSRMLNGEMPHSQSDTELSSPPKPLKRYVKLPSFLNEEITNRNGDYSSDSDLSDDCSSSSYDYMYDKSSDTDFSDLKGFERPDTPSDSDDSSFSWDPPRLIAVCKPASQ